MANGPYRRSTTDRKLAGVCGGLAQYFGMDATLVRVLWVVLTLVSFGAGIVGYILLWVLAPEDGPGAPTAATPIAAAKPAQTAKASKPRSKPKA
jgi:phage shock protein PspC (stress-responsive transcriptional regulator)